jgi:hypothetical protein
MEASRLRIASLPTLAVLFSCHRGVASQRFTFLLSSYSVWSQVMASVVKAQRTKKAATEVDQNPVAVEAKPKRTRKAAAEPRIKLYWGVFNQHLKRVAVFEYQDVKKAEKHAKELSKDGNDHFLQKIKEVVT